MISFDEQGEDLEATWLDDGEHKGKVFTFVPDDLSETDYEE